MGEDRGGERAPVHGDGRVLSIEETADELVVHLGGEFDLANYDALRFVLREATRRSRSVVIDLTGVSFIGAMGIRQVLTAAHEAAARGSRISVRHAPPMVRRMADVIGAEDIFR